MEVVQLLWAQGKHVLVKLLFKKNNCYKETAQKMCIISAWKVKFNRKEGSKGCQWTKEQQDIRVKTNPLHI